MSVSETGDPEMTGEAPALALLPSNASAFEVAQSQASARLFDLNVAVIERSRDPAHCDPAFTPFLAWERSVHFYDPSDEAGNRARTETSFSDHLAYGAPPALEAEIALDTGQNVRIREFFEERDLVWPDFVVESIIAPGPAMPDLDALMASAIARKNVRDFPIVRTFVTQPPAPVYVGCCHSISIAMRPASKPAPCGPFVGAGQRLMPRMQVNPQ